MLDHNCHLSFLSTNLSTNLLGAFMNTDEKTNQPSILETTLKAATKDKQLIQPDGRPLGRLTEGVIIKSLPTHADARGSVTELFDPRWGLYPDPLVFAYTFTLRPGFVKGWNLHKLHQDRYCVLQGEMELVLYDPRPDSSTYGEICRIAMSESDRRIVNVPKYVWHADYNIGTKDVVVVNFPTTMYDHQNPDKYRLPIDTPLIPYTFPDAKGW
jgi:dTDP-4-dehydrorhamnose 3,5-epimerase